MSIKRWISYLLTPLVKITLLLSPLQRVWAYTCLQTKLNIQLPLHIVVLNCPEIQGSGRIYLGDNLYLYRELYLETQGMGEIIIGDHVVISRGVHLVAFNKIQIGHHTMIGEYTSIRDANHDFSTEKPLRDAGHKSAPISIGHNVWIGRGVTILAGVTIGDHAVIGANAVVTKSIPPYTITVGIPAKVKNTFNINNLN